MARRIAEMKVCAHRWYRVATRLEFFKDPNICRCRGVFCSLYCRLLPPPCEASCPGSRTFPPFCQRFPEPVGVIAPICQQQVPQQHGGTHVISDLIGKHDELVGRPLASASACNLVLMPPLVSPIWCRPHFLPRRIDVARCALR